MGWSPFRRENTCIAKATHKGMKASDTHTTCKHWHPRTAVNGIFTSHYRVRHLNTFLLQVWRLGSPRLAVRYSWRQLTSEAAKLTPPLQDLMPLSQQCSSTVWHKILAKHLRTLSLCRHLLCQSRDTKLKRVKQESARKQTGAPRTPTCKTRHKPLEGAGRSYLIGQSLWSPKHKSRFYILIRSIKAILLYSYPLPYLQGHEDHSWPGFLSFGGKKKIK